MNNIEVKHIHANVGMNGQLYYIVDDRLLIVSVCSPNFNDYGEFRIGEFKLSSEKYNPSANECKLNPYIIESFFINAEDLLYLDTLSAYLFSAYDSPKRDANYKTFIDKYVEPDEIEEELCGGILKNKDIVIIKDNEYITQEKWNKSESKSHFEKIAYPLLYGFISGYILEHDIKAKRKYKLNKIL